MRLWRSSWQPTETSRRGREPGNLDDPDNVRDLLRQAREAGMPCLTASQSLPEPGGCRNQLLQAGVLLFLKCLPADADEFAMLAGTVIGRALVHEASHDCAGLPERAGHHLGQTCLVLAGGTSRQQPAGRIRGPAKN
jgi:hypothetical protein